MNTSWRVRPYRVNDELRLKAIFKDNIESFPGSESFRAGEREYVEESLAADGDMSRIPQVFGDAFWVLERISDGTAHGMVGLIRHTTHTAELIRFHLSPEARGQKCGTFMMNKVMDYARAHGITRIELSTVSSYERARAFYERFGFVHERQRDTPLHPHRPEVTERLVVYSLQLDSERSRL